MKRTIKNGKMNYLKEDCTLLSDEWFDSCEIFHNGYARVRKDGKWNLLRKDGTLLCRDWFDNKPKKLFNKYNFYIIYSIYRIYYLTKIVKVKLID